MQHTTRETTYKLHHAGFPEHMPEAGQHWWHPDYSEPILCAGPSEWSGEYLMVMPGPRIESKGADFFVSAVFAPTATDILRELGERYVLWFDDSRKVMKWVCARAGNSIHNAGKPILNDNPAEAAAADWLAATEFDHL